MESRWGNLIEIEKYLRIKLSIAAYAYEVKDHSILTDYDYDMLSLKVNTSISTGNELMDNFFKEHFDPSSGLWIQKHPEIDKIKYIYEKYYTNKG